jgi:hypothetical protein
MSFLSFFDELFMALKVMKYPGNLSLSQFLGCISVQKEAPNICQLLAGGVVYQSDKMLCAGIRSNRAIGDSLAKFIQRLFISGIW